MHAVILLRHIECSMRKGQITSIASNLGNVAMKKARIAVDIGGTFTDIAIEKDGEFITAKTPTTLAQPVEGVLKGIRHTMELADLKPTDISTVIHGTTLATNALIERKGARVATITTEGFRDILEIAYERRYDQYDLMIDKPDMIVTRDLCYTVPERIDPDGSVYRALDESCIDDLIRKIDRDDIQSLAISLLHSYVNDSHELRLRELLLARHPQLSVSLSCEVSPKIGEFERLCTTLANAYIRPLMDDYLCKLEQAVIDEGFDCPLYIITSGGGMTTPYNARQFPIRMVESGPSGGAVLAAKVARDLHLDEVVSFDMGGTTAKLCLIDKGQPQTARRFEIARSARFLPGSGMPVLIPVIEMIEIGAGGGSIAHVDSLGRLNVGPESAGAEPGPACYANGGTRPTVTDADTAIGYLEPASFAEGRLKLDRSAAETALQQHLGDALGVSVQEAAYGLVQIVDENMANAARVHAVERGKDLRTRSMIAFGGNGPLHAAAVAEKIGVDTIIVPRGPGVGSAIGFLFAPIAYEIVRSHHTLVTEFDFAAINCLLADMEAQAREVVSAGAFGQPLAVQRNAFMRYRGQGHEIEVKVPEGVIDESGLALLSTAYDTEYARLFARKVPGMSIEIMNWSVSISTKPSEITTISDSTANLGNAPIAGEREVFFGERRQLQTISFYHRDTLLPGHSMTGPALIIEPQTTSYVSALFDASIDSAGNIVMQRKAEEYTHVN
jgi:N-methylhydantoinase A